MIETAFRKALRCKGCGTDWTGGRCKYCGDDDFLDVTRFYPDLRFGRAMEGDDRPKLRPVRVHETQPSA